MKEKQEAKYSNKKECPYCHSSNIELAGIKMGLDTVKRAGQGYKCLTCGNFFLHVEVPGS
ncbi:MAG: hypothetical protein HZC17_04470 [Candidatus Omnitrophica bacterium]|nr:hypothetical protein [Candidatus Omnitrophota bacterium]